MSRVTPKRKKESSKEKGKSVSMPVCVECKKKLSKGKKALFVEEEVGRVFCSEKCISNYFADEVAELERDYLDHRPKNDLVIEDDEVLQQLKWATLQDPHEIWREESKNGHYRYALLSELDVEGTKAWYVCLCLFLKGEPSFLFLGFATLNPIFVEKYRRGEPVDVLQAPKSDEEKSRSDRLASEWTEEETFRAGLLQVRKPGDIPVASFDQYESKLEPTLEKPDELWTLAGDEGKENMGIFSFIRQFKEGRQEFWYVVVAKEMDDEEQLEILEAFPTTDPELVEQCRRGEKQVGSPGLPTSMPSVRVVH